MMGPMPGTESLGAPADGNGGELQGRNLNSPSSSSSTTSSHSKNGFASSNLNGTTTTSTSPSSYGNHPKRDAPSARSFHDGNHSQTEQQTSSGNTRKWKNEEENGSPVKLHSNGENGEGRSVVFSPRPGSPLYRASMDSPDSIGGTVPLSWRPGAGVEALKHQLSLEKKRNLDMSLEMSATIRERDQIKVEYEKLRTAAMASEERRSRRGRIQFEVEDTRNVIKELQDELSFLRSANLNLNVQLQKTQESNSELLKEIEELVGGRAVSKEPTLMADMASSERSRVVEEMRETVEMLQRDLQEMAEKNSDLIAQLKLKEEDEVKMVPKEEMDTHLELELRRSEEIAMALRMEVSDLKEKLREHEKERYLSASQKGQLKMLREKVAKVEQEYENELRNREDLEAVNRSLKEERDLLAVSIEKKVRAAEEAAIAQSECYEERLKAMSGLQLENGRLSEKISTLINERKREEDARKEAFEEIEGRLHAKEAEKRKLESQLEEFRYEDANKTSCINNLERRLLESEGNVKVIEAENSQLMKTIEGLREEVCRLTPQGGENFESSTGKKLALLKELNELKERESAAKKKVAEMEQEMSQRKEEMDDMRERLQNYEYLQCEAEEYMNSFNKVKLERDQLDASFQEVCLQNVKLSEELKVMKEKPIIEERATKTKPSKVPPSTPPPKGGGKKPVETNDKDRELVKLRRQNAEFRRKLSEQQGEKEELEKRLSHLEEDRIRLQTTEVASLAERKVNGLESKAERKVNGVESKINRASGVSSSMKRPLKAKSSSKGAMENTAVLASRELADLQEKVKLLEEEAKAKASELDSSKQKLEEKESELSARIQHLELANQHVAVEHVTSFEELQKAMDQLQNQNRAFSERERELLSQLRSQETLQNDVKKLVKKKEELESALAKFNGMPIGPEKEMGNTPLFQSDIQGQGEGNSNRKVESERSSSTTMDSLVHEELQELQRKNVRVEEELREMRERYLMMSMNFAEVEAQREELVMTVKSLQSKRDL